MYMIWYDVTPICCCFLFEVNNLHTWNAGLLIPVWITGSSDYHYLENPPHWEPFHEYQYLEEQSHENTSHGISLSKEYSPL